VLAHIGAWQGVVLDGCVDVLVKIGKRMKGHKYEVNIVIMYVYDRVSVSYVCSPFMLKRCVRYELSCDSLYDRGLCKRTTYYK
jgi:hypothetical protein